VTTILLDSHALQWWSAEPDRLSAAAREAIAAADELAVSAITWFELAWLAENGRIVLAVPVRSWLTELAAGVRTAGITPPIAHKAAALPRSFPGDPADRLIYATAVEHDWQLATKDGKMREFPQPRKITVW
jgi:PIN domain nuclease of toxin-antitoxin system